MRTTIELPDDLVQRAKTQAALRGIEFGYLVQESLQQFLESPDLVKPVVDQLSGPSLYDLMKDCCGIVDSGVSDLATNPKYMEGFGSDSMGHR